MKTRFTLSFLALLGTHFAIGDSGVRSGNLQGVSSTAFAQQLTIPRPEPPLGFTAERINKSRVKITIGAVPPGNAQYCRLMRATNDQPWVKVGNWPVNAIPSEYLDIAPAGQNYRYLVQTTYFSGMLADGGPGQVTSAPSAIQEIGDVVAQMTAGQWSYAEQQSPAVGVFSASRVFKTETPDPIEAVDPDPFHLNGPFSYTLTKNVFAKTRTMTTLSAYIDTKDWLSFAYADMTSDHPSTDPYNNGENIPITYPDGSGGNRFIMEGSIGFYDSNWSGTPERGYDNASNPNWQMLPKDGGEDGKRSVSLKIEPNIGTRIFALNAFGITIKDTFTGGLVLSVKPGATGLEISHDGTPPLGNILLSSGLRIPLMLDSRPRVEVKVKVVRLRMRGLRNGGIWTQKDEDVPNPDITALTADLNATYAEQANIYFTVDKETIIVDDDDDESTPNENVDGIPAFDLPGRPLVTGGAWYTQRANTNRTNGYLFTIFCAEDAKTRAKPTPNVPIPPISTNLNSFANSNEPDIALFAVITKWASTPNFYPHEIGHLLGLYHPWFADGDYGEEKLPDNARSRVMAYDNTGRRLVKPERDVIHGNLIELLEKLNAPQN